MTCQPAAENIAADPPAAMLGTTRSSDCRFMSMIQTISPSSLHRRIQDRLPHRALIEFRVTD